MKKMLYLYLKISFIFILCSCNTNISSSKSTNSIPLPGGTRQYFGENFESVEETEIYINNILSASVNGDFSMGLSNFTLLDDYELKSMGFWGLIDEKSPIDPENDPFGAKYKFFRIMCHYGIKETENKNLPHIYLYYFPFALNKEFNNHDIRYETTWRSGDKISAFYFENEEIMSLEINYSNDESIIEDNQMINELINNFYLITK